MRRFLMVWLIGYPAMNGIATLFPVAMTREFAMDPIMPSLAYAIGVAASLLLYAPLGAATHRLGGGRMLLLGFGARLALLGVLAVARVRNTGWIGWLVLVGFALIQFVWPLLAVATNSLSVRLAPTARGESVGLFNAATSLAASVGSALAGVIFGAAGFAGLTAVTFVAVAVALALIRVWLVRREVGLMNRTRIGAFLRPPVGSSIPRKPAALSYGLEELPPAVVTWVSALQHVGVCSIFMVYPLADQP